MSFVLRIEQMDHQGGARNALSSVHTHGMADIIRHGRR